MDLPTAARSFALFVFAGLIEIGGGYLVWLWLRDGRGIERRQREVTKHRHGLPIRQCRASTSSLSRSSVS